uniref:DUF5753 domain-containing protein n=1 Tax=Steinernema glaseri TaxID=37863 RepID=A0A1I7YZT6_9BILA
MSPYVGAHPILGQEVPVSLLLVDPLVAVTIGPRRWAVPRSVVLSARVVLE